MDRRVWAKGILRDITRRHYEALETKVATHDGPNRITTLTTPVVLWYADLAISGVFSAKEGPLERFRDESKVASFQLVYPERLVARASWFLGVF
ncbi:MAG: hypothetical protein Q9186_000514 [Xanthomendoza sp. 1 TL-2023]